MWSFGVTAVEIFQDGIQPFTGMSNPAVMELVKNGGYHGQPAKCHDVVLTASRSVSPNKGQIQIDYVCPSAPAMHLRCTPMGRTCRWAGGIKDNTQPEKLYHPLSCWRNA